MKLASILALIGTALALVAAAAYFTPALDLPFLNAGTVPKMIVAGLGAGWALVGTIQSFRLGRSGAAKALLGLMLLASLGAAGAIPVHAYVLSNNAAAQQSNLP
ncbi:MAG: hypothetical protein IT462_02460 [Planctomycetes bacterium]|nr:hypothetical protein [Planctomycetota bacterium]